MNKYLFSEITNYKKCHKGVTIQLSGSAGFGAGHETSTSLFSSWGLGAHNHEFGGSKQLIFEGTSFSEITKYKQVTGVLQFNYQGSADFGGEGHETSTSRFSSWGLGAHNHELRGSKKLIFDKI